jgi:D-cysteine desulfhydrase
LSPRRPAGLVSTRRLPLGLFPTPLQPAPQLSAELGVEVWLKRDDLTGVGMGGNKIRKLEFLMADMAARGADVILTAGGAISNHVQLTAAAAARQGVRCHLVLYGDRPDPAPMNLTLAEQLGAIVTFTGDPRRDSVDPGLEQAAEEERAAGRVPYVVGRGGATPVGCLGYVDAAFELGEQLEEHRLECTAVFLATGSCGTHAGLFLGQQLSGARWALIGGSVSRPIPECRTRIAALAAGAADLIGERLPEGAEAAIDVRDAIGPGYGEASKEGQAAAALAAATEGLLLDPVYTAKAMSVLVTEARAGRITGPAVFLHTGGAGGLLGGH